MKIVRDHIASWIEIPQFVESRGILSALEFDQLPFVPSRIFFTSNVPVGEVRGGHAHKCGEQIMFCMSGKIEILLKTGTAHQLVVCKPNGKGLFLKPGIWAQQTYLEEDSRLLVLCSHPYDPSSYVDDDNLLDS